MNDLGSTVECDNDQVCYETTYTSLNPEFRYKDLKERSCGQKGELGCFVELPYDIAFANRVSNWYVSYY